MAALWFAVRCPPINGESGVVWAFETRPKDYVDPKRDRSPFRVERTLVFRPRHITRRIIAQSGWFTVHKFLEESGRLLIWPSTPSTGLD